MLSKSFDQATLRVVTPVCHVTGRIGLAFNAGADVVRLALDVRDALVLCDLVRNYVSSRGSDQSPGSALISSAPMSVPSDGVKT